MKQFLLTLVVAVAVLSTSCERPEIEPNKNCGTVLDMGYNDVTGKHTLYVMTGISSQVQIDVPVNVYNNTVVGQRYCW
jgi:hypothetical protein